MSEAKFTKGEWNFNQDFEVDDQMVIKDDNHVVICCLESDINFDGDGYFNQMTDKQEANAHLIAAAPEMYNLLASIENDDKQVPEWLWNKIQETLAEARGESCTTSD